MSANPYIACVLGKSAAPMPTMRKGSLRGVAACTFQPRSAASSDTSLRRAPDSSRRTRSTAPRRAPPDEHRGDVSRTRLQDEERREDEYERSYSSLSALSVLGRTRHMAASVGAALVAQSMDRDNR